MKLELFCEAKKEEQQLLLCGFPGVGKSTFIKKNPSFLDSDSSTFDKSKFPTNYVDHIVEKLSKNKSLLVSTHEDVRTELLSRSIPITIVYPSKSLKSEYLKRYQDRGNGDGFVKLLKDQWDSWITDIEELESPFVNKIKLKSGEFISDVITDLEDEIVPQKVMIERMKESSPVVLNKKGKSKIRLATPGEKIITKIDGKVETSNTAKDGDCVVIGPENEEYIISLSNAKKRYKIDTPVTESYSEYVATGKARGYEHLGPTFSFEAPWEETMLCEPGDYLVSNEKGPVKEVYRIARKVFDKMWKEQVDK